MSFTKTTESNSNYNHLEKMEVKELLVNINKEDQTVAESVSKAIPQIERVTKRVITALKNGGRLFYLGAGTSGRMGILDASECPPTFGVSHDLVIGLIAGGDSAIRKAVEFAEDSEMEGWKDLQDYDITTKDFVIGIAASGTTPYVIGALKMCNKNGIETACITCNAGSPVALTAQYPIEVTVGPEFVTGSTRMKAGTAQKMVLNMISTTAMIHIGKIKGNKMVDMQLSNNKLIERGVKMIMEELNLPEREARQLLDKHQSVRDVLKYYSNE